MASKEIMLNNKAQERIKIGIDKLANAVKVTRVALENAGSIAGMVLMTECAVFDKPEKKKEPAMNGSHMYDDAMM